MSESLGDMLRAAREAKNLTLEDVERITRIRVKYLAALEVGAYEELPSPVQLRGFLRNYAQHVGLDAERMLALYEQARGKPLLRGVLPAPAPAPRPVYQPRIPQVRSRRPRWLSADVLVAVIVTVGLGSLLVWGAFQLAARLQSGAGGTPVAQVTASATPTATLGAGGDEPTSAPLPSPLPVYIGVNITVRAEQRLWMSAKADGVEQFAGLMKPGDAKDFVGQTSVELTTGNGKGTRVIWNGRDQGTLGEVGEVVTRIWNLEGMVIPTATVTPTPTATEPPTATPRPSVTPRP